ARRRARVVRGRRRAAAGLSSALHGTPAREKLVGVQLRELLAQRTSASRSLLRRQVPEQHDFAVVDVDQLDVVDALDVCEQRRRTAAARDDQAVGGLRLHGAIAALASICSAARSIIRSPAKTAPSTTIAGAARTPASIAALV